MKIQNSFTSNPISVPIIENNKSSTSPKTNFLSTTLVSSNEENFLTIAFSKIGNFISAIGCFFHSIIKKLFYCFDYYVSEKNPDLKVLLEKKSTFENLKVYFQDSKKTKSREEFTKEWKEKFDLLSDEDQKSIVMEDLKAIVRNQGCEEEFVSAFADEFYDIEEVRSDSIDFVRNLKVIKAKGAWWDPIDDAQVPSYLSNVIVETQKNISK